MDEAGKWRSTKWGDEKLRGPSPVALLGVHFKQESIQRPHASRPSLPPAAPQYIFLHLGPASQPLP